jgi:cytochrome c peroxidase
LIDDAQVADIVAFLVTLSGPFPTQQMPRLPPTPGDLID